ncbi:MAG: response regulator [Deltaproteobacteria bacterium]|nr:response regulator [Deltaproteobacteria bacterium]
MSRKMQLLLVDDDPQISWGVGRCLTRAGCAVTTCGNGEEAIKVLKSKEFEFLITDIQMPRLNGLALIEWVAQNRPRMRIVAITAFGCPSVQQVVLKKGAILYIEKPFDPDILIETIKKPKPRKSFCGNVDSIDLFDYVQLVFVTMRELVLEISSCDGEEGLIFVKEGSACHAECGEIEGEEAFFKCLSFEGGAFVTLPWREPVKTTIDRRGDFLLMEAARSKDENDEIIIENESPEAPKSASESSLVFDLGNLNNQDSEETIK